MRRLAAGSVRWRSEDWKALNYSRLSVLPVEALPQQRAELLAALSLGSEILRLRRVARRFDLQAELNPAFDAVARGDSAPGAAASRGPRREAGDARRDRVANIAPAPGRGRILAISELLTQHSAYFEFETGPMNFSEINLFGVYVAPISVMMVATWVVLIALRRVAARFGLLRYVWHPAMFVFSLYVILLSACVLLLAR